MTALSLGEATMLAVAKRIARLAAEGQVKEAKRQYLAHLSEMNAEEQAQFKSALLRFAAEVL